MLPIKSQSATFYLVQKNSWNSFIVCSINHFYTFLIKKYHNATSPLVTDKLKFVKFKLKRIRSLFTLSWEITKKFGVFWLVISPRVFKETAETKNNRPKTGVVTVKHCKVSCFSFLMEIFEIRVFQLGNRILVQTRFKMIAPAVNGTGKTPVLLSSCYENHFDYVWGSYKKIEKFLNLITEISSSILTFVWWSHYTQSEADFLFSRVAEVVAN